MAQDSETRDMAGAACGARAVSVATGVLMLWRAIGAPPLGPVMLGLAGIGLVWHGLSGRRLTPAVVPEERAVPRRRNGPKDSDPVHRASDESFPASDPPSWTPTNGPARRH